MCPCKRIKKEFLCELVKQGAAEVNCDETCEQKKREEETIRRIELKQKIKEEEVRNQKELEKYEKMFQGKRKNKERKIREKTETKGFLHRYKMPTFFVVFGIISALFYTYII